MFTTLITAADLHAHMNDPDWVVVDCRFDLAAPAAGEQAYAAAHVPRAVYAHLDRDLSSPITPSSGRHPLPEPHALARTFSRLGIDASTQVVAYDQDSGAYAARLWWLLRWLGHRAAAVLDGGYAAWTEAGYPTTTVIQQPVPRSFTPRVDPNAVITADDVPHYTSFSRALLDARASERYAGSVEPLDTVAGHIPGARNHPFLTNLDSSKRFLSPAELKERYQRSLAGTAPSETAVMCGSGVTACHLLLGMEHAGLTGAKLYAGSWSEWIRDPKRPIKTGAEP